MENDMNMYKIINLTKYKELILHYCNLLGMSSIQRLLQKNKSSFSIIEKIIYDIARFELNKKNMNIDDDNLYITFFCKSKLSKNLNNLGFHTDIDDYEHRIKNTNTLSPIISSLLYLNESNNPIFMTNIEKYETDFNRINKNFSLVFPSEFVNVSFNGGKYYHSECNIFMENNENKKRDVIVILIWNKCPKHVPIYDDHSFLYEISWKYLNIDLDNYSMNHEKEKNLLIFKKYEQNIIKISDKIINNSFYEELFKENDNMFKFIIPYLNKYNNHKNILFIVSENEEEELIGEEGDKFITYDENKEIILEETIGEETIGEETIGEETILEQETKESIQFITYDENKEATDEEKKQSIQFITYDENKINIQEELTLPLNNNSYISSHPKGQSINGLVIMERVPLFIGQSVDCPSKGLTNEYNINSLLEQTPKMGGTLPMNNNIPPSDAEEPNELLAMEGINNILGCNLNKWEIDFGNEEETNEHLGILLNDCISSDVLEYVYLLDHSKNNLDIIEKYIHDIVEFHLSNMNIKLDHSIFIEFWFKTYSNYNMHIDSDDIRVSKNNASPRPFLSCITYLNDHELPSVFTNISLDSYKTKKIEENNSLIFYFPKKLNHIIFDGGNYFHSKCNLFNNKYELKERNTLLINLWNTKPMDIKYYDSTSRNEFFDGNQYRMYSYNKYKVLPIINFKNQNYKYKTYETNKKVLSKDFFEEILYKKKDQFIFNNFNTFFENYKETGHNVFVLKEKKIQDNKNNKFNTPLYIDYNNINNQEKNISENASIKGDTHSMNNKTIDNVPPLAAQDERVNQEENILVRDFIEKNTCNNIIQEYKNHIKKNNFDINKKIDCENIESIFEIIMNRYFETLLNIISKDFSINNKLNVTKISVFNNINNNNEENIYNESIVANILLSKQSIYINNKLINQGDLFVVNTENLFNIIDAKCCMLEFIIDCIK